MATGAFLNSTVSRTTTTSLPRLSKKTPPDLATTFASSLKPASSGRIAEAVGVMALLAVCAPGRVGRPSRSSSHAPSASSETGNAIRRQRRHARAGKPLGCIDDIWGVLLWKGVARRTSRNNIIAFVRGSVWAESRGSRGEVTTASLPPKPTSALDMPQAAVRDCRLRYRKVERVGAVIESAIGALYQVAPLREFLAWRLRES